MLTVKIVVPCSLITSFLILDRQACVYRYMKLRMKGNYIYVKDI